MYTEHKEERTKKYKNQVLNRSPNTKEELFFFLGEGNIKDELLRATGALGKEPETI